MTTVNVQRASTVKAVGTHNGKNCKAVFCITTGEVYASVLDAAEANGLTSATMSYLINNNSFSRKANKKFCFIAHIAEHLEEIAANNRARQQKVAKYDAIEAHKEAIRKASEEYEKRKATCDALRQKLATETELMNKASENLATLKQGDN